MPRFPNERELLETAMRAFYTNNPELNPDVVRKEGSDPNLLAASAAAVGGAVAHRGEIAMDGLFLLTARGDNLDTFVLDRYNLPREEASSSVGQLRFSRTSTQKGQVTVDKGTRITVSGGEDPVVVETLNAISFGANDLGPFDVDAIAVDTGEKTNVDAGLLTVPVSGLPDSSMSVTNPDEFAGGEDREEDDDYRGRAINFWKGVVRGTLRAVENGALTAPGISRANAEELLDTDGLPYGSVRLVVGDSRGQGNSAMLTHFTGAGQGVLKEFKCGGIYVDVQSGARVLVEISIQGTFKAGTNTTLAISQVKRVVAAWVNHLKSGENLEPPLIYQAAQSVNGFSMSDGDVLVPAGVLTVNPNETIRTNEALIKVNGQ